MPVAEVGKFIVYKTNDYLVQFVDYKSTTNPADNWPKRFEDDQYMFSCEFIDNPRLVDKEYVGKKITVFCSQKLILQDPTRAKDCRSKFAKIVEAAFGRPAEDGENVEPKDLMGRQMWLTVIDEGEKNSLGAFKPVKGQTLAPVRAPGEFAVGPDADDGDDEWGEEAQAAGPITQKQNDEIAGLCTGLRFDKPTLKAIITKAVGSPIVPAKLNTDQAKAVIQTIRADYADVVTNDDDSPFGADTTPKA
jgi:hypothetical protein